MRWTEDLWHKSCAPLLCAGITTFAPLRRHCRAGDDVAVVGIGGLGHLGVKFARAQGLRVTAFSGKKDVTDILAMGACRVVNSRDLKAV